MNGFIKPVLLLLFFFLLSGCGGGGDTETEKPVPEPTPIESSKKRSVAMSYQILESISSCLNGGVEIKTGIDENGNGSLDNSEIDNTDFVCHGTNGTDGTNSLLKIIDEPAGEVCLYGGIHINVGLDVNTNDVLDLEEVSQSATVCYPSAPNPTPGDVTTVSLATIKGNIALSSNIVVASKSNNIVVASKSSNIVRSSQSSNIVRSSRMAITKPSTYSITTSKVIESSVTLILAPSSITANATNSEVSELAMLSSPTEIIVDADGNYETQVPAGTDYSLILNDTQSGTGVKLENIAVQEGETITQDISASEILPTGSVKLKVASLLNGNALEAAKITLVELATDKFTTVDGAQEFIDLPAGTYHLLIHHSDYVSKHLSFVVTSNVATDLQTIELNNQKGSASGQVSSPSDLDLSNILVYARASDNSVYSTFTNNSGTFTFPALPVAEGYRFIVVSNLFDSAKSNDVTILRNQTTIVETFELAERKANTGSITGYIKYSDKLAQLEHSGIIVAVEGTDKEAISSRDGSFIINGLASGTYQLNFTEANHQAVSASVEITSGTVNNLDLFELASLNGSLSGTVVDHNDQPLSNVTLILHESGQTTISDISGNFIFTNHPVGTYTLIANNQGYGTQQVEVLLTQDQTTTLNNSIQLTPYNFSGTVSLGSDKSDHSAVTISLSGTGLSEQSNVDGSFAFSAIQPGNYQLQFSRSGYKSQSISVVISAENNELGYAINMDPMLGIVNGQASIDNRIDHSGIQVSIIGTQYSAFTDSTGKWSMSMALGNYSGGVHYQKDYYTEQVNSQAITVTENGEFTVAPAKLLQNNANIILNVGAANTCSGELIVFAQGINGLAEGFSGNLSVSANGDVNQALPLGEYQFTIYCTDSGWEANNFNILLSNEHDSYPLEDVNLRQSFVIVNDGAAYTNNQLVSISLGNTDAIEMRITDGLSDSGWIAFESLYDHTLSVGNGLKTVTAQFKDINNVELASVSDTIQLDTFLNVADFQHSGATTKGDLLHLELSLTQELGATVTVTIPGLVQNLPLLDNGFGGDTTPNDGIYERDFYIDTPIDLNLAAVATVTDISGNTATANSSSNVILNTAPSIKNLVTSSNIALGEMTLRFSTDEPATASIAYGNDSANLSNNLEVSTTLNNNHSVTLSSLSANSMTYFRIAVADSVNNTNELAGQGKLAPPAVTGLAAYPGSNEVGLIWNKAQNAASYRIYRSDDGGNVFTLVNAETVISERYYVDALASNAISYSYRITAIDTDSNESENSAAVTVTPTVILAGPTAIAGGLIDINTVWLKSRSPYNISANVKVKKDVELLLLPGTEVAFTAADLSIYLSGSMSALGQADNLVKLTAFDAGNSNYSGALIYEQGNTAESQFTFAELNYLKAYYDYENSWDRQSYLVPLQVSNSEVHYFSNGGYSDHYINSIKNSNISILGWGSTGNSNSIRVNSLENIVVTSSGFGAQGEIIDNVVNGLYAKNITGSTFTNISLYTENGSIDNSQFTNATINNAGSLSNSTITNSTISGRYALRANSNTLINTQISLPGDNTRLTMRYNNLDSNSTVSAKFLDISHNYWGSTDLAAITAQTGYSPDQTKNTHFYPIITSSALYLADWDNDTIPDYLDYDNDNDGYSDLQEDWSSDPVYGSIYSPLDADSHPLTAKDNDMDELADSDDLDDDNDGLADSDELIRLTDPFLADSDGDGVNDGNEVSYKYNPLDNNNFPLMGNITGITINNSNVNSEGVVYIAGLEQYDAMMDYYSIASVNLTDVNVSAGTSLMIDKNTPITFTDSVLIGDDANVITMRSTGAGNGSITFSNTKVDFANIKIAINSQISTDSVLEHSDLFLSAGLYNSGVIRKSAITSSAYWNNAGDIEASFILGGYFSNQGVINNSYIATNGLDNNSAINQSYINRVSANNNSQINGSVIASLSSYNDASTISNSDVRLNGGQTMNVFFDGAYLSLGYDNSFYTGYGEPLDQIGDGVAETQFTVEYEGAGLETGTWTVDGINNPRSTPNFPDVVFKPYLEASGIWSPKGVGAWWDMNNAEAFPESDPSNEMGTISGQVQLAGFANHAGVTVEIINTSLSTVTDAQGHWSIRLPARDYVYGISFTKAHIETMVKDRSYSVVAQQDNDIGILAMAQTTAKVTGVLAIDEASDYTLATITANRNGQSTTINPSVSGEFVFTALVLSDYTFDITYPDGSWETVTHQLTLADGQTEYTLPVTRVRNSFVYINNGAYYTNTDNVNLAITNANATNMVVTESGAALPSEAFSAVKAITLSTGDGEKVIQVDFTDIDGNALTPATSTIILDTQVSLTSLTLSAVSTMNDTVHIALMANEVDGGATVTVPGLFTDLSLYDNGLQGDSVANDGIYETDYLITTAEDITATATASFVDRASNNAVINSSTDLAITTSPTVSELLVQTLDGKLVISFATDELTTATINFGTDPNNLDQTATVSVDELSEHVISLTANANEAIYFTIITNDGVTTVTELMGTGVLAQPAVSGVNISAGDGEIGLVWTKQPAATGYRIYRSEDSNTFTELAQVDAESPYYVDASVYNEQRYYYRVTWLDANAIESDQSASQSAIASTENSGATELDGGVIAVNEIWLKSRSPYIITGNMLIKEAATLSLMAGTEIEFNGAKRHIMVQGNIMAYGSAVELVKISTDPVYNYSGGENGDQSAIIYDTSNNTASEFNFTELNYLQVYYDYSDIYQRNSSLVPLSLSNSIVNGYYGSRANFYIQSATMTTINEYGYGYGGGDNYYGVMKVGSIEDVTFNKLDVSGNQSTTTSYIARINNAVNSIFNGAIFYFENGTIDNSTFVNATVGRASTITNSFFTDSAISGDYSLRLTGSDLINSHITLTGDNTRLTMHYSLLDTDSTVTAKLLDISHNYWGSTDLTAIAQQSGYSPDQANNTHLYPIITSSNLYVADWDLDTIPDYLDYDNDNDGYSDLQEDWESDPVYGAIFNPLDDTSYPSVANDNDMDGLPDDEDLDDDNDGLLDSDEPSYGTDAFLADSDGDGITDGDEVRYNYNPLDKNNFPLMGNISGKTIDNSNASSDGVVYLVGYEANDGMIQAVQLTNVTVIAGTSLMINKDTTVIFNDSIITGSTDNIVTIRSSGAGNGSFNLTNTQVNFANIKLAISWNINGNSIVARSDLSLNTSGWNNGIITDSFIIANTNWYNNGLIEHSYISGSSFHNYNQGVIKFSIINLETIYTYFHNIGSINNSYVSNLTYQQSNSTITDSVIDKLWSSSSYNSQVINSDIQFYSAGSSFPMFFDNTFISDPSGSVFYGGYGSPVDQLGDGVAETLFNLNGSNYTVDGINNPRSTKNFPNGVDDIWIPEGVGALWDANAVDPTLFPEPVL
jgi:hypothetical protein